MRTRTTEGLEALIHEVPKIYNDVDRAEAIAYLLIGALKLRAWLRNVHNEVLHHQIGSW